MSKKLPLNKEIEHTLYLIGDSGEMDDEQARSNYVVDGMVSMMNMNDYNSSVVFLGDNVYPIGLVDQRDSVKRKKGEDILYAQLNPLKNYVGETYMIPGNHDWNKDKKGGLQSVIRQEAFVESEFGKKIKFYPNMGCGDPEVVKINKEVVYIFIDSQWWLQKWKQEKQINEGCEITSRGDFLARMEELFLKYKNKEIICMLHHPIKSNGNHGGYFSLKQHVFPLAELGVWLPLPIIGSIYPIYRQATGSIQDNTHIRNQNLTKGLESLAQKHRINVVFASGHEHGLEFYESSKIKYIVSGSGSKTSYIQSGGEASYARQARGFARLLFYSDFESWLEFYTLSETQRTPQLEYRVQLRTARAGTAEDDEIYPKLTQKDTLFAANDAFKAGAFKKAMLGEQYRDMWATPVKAPLIDLETQYGGLTPIKKGGGMSSNSLRMQHESGKQYILRSIRKDYRKLVPEGYENLRLLDIMKDQNSASHPYGALAIPTLSKAANVYYTEPKLVFLKHQKGLGNYNKLFPEELYLLEERPSGDWSDDPKFGNAREIIGYTDLLKTLRKKKNHFVDQKWVLKSRIFDLLIHDWDRHDDQWRWAKFKDKDRTFYRPIPRDRDQAFYKFVGFIPTIVSAFLLKKFKTMKHDVKDVKNLSFNAKHFDRYFLNELEWDEWEPIIEALQSNITDDIIEEAMNQIPEEVREIDNAHIISMLKSRRSKLKDVGNKLYRYLAKEVEIIGTDNIDHFKINYISDGHVQVQYYVELKDKTLVLKYDRTFYSDETDEIRLYGLRGEDTFTTSGVVQPQIKLTVIGGEDNDVVHNTTPFKGLDVYDSSAGIQIKGQAYDNTSNDYTINEYNRNGFQYNSGLPLLNFGNTQDDGWWIGGGYSWTNRHWRKLPYSSKNLISFSIAPGSQNAFQIELRTERIDVIGKLDIIAAGEANFPRYENYFGLGNNSINPQRELTFNWVKLQSVTAQYLAKANINNSSFIKFGPIFQSHDINRTDGRVSTDEIIGFEEQELDRRNYLGVRIAPHFEHIDNKTFPTNGISFHAEFNYLKELDRNESITEFDISATTYIRLFANPKLVLANAVGYSKRWGDLLFHQYADLGNTSHLRGYRNNRFRGQSAIFHNLDIRFQVLDWDNTWLPMEIGLVGGHDLGRVWLADEVSTKWHRSTTIGVWFNVLDLAVVQPYYSFVADDEGDVFSLLLGFNF